jgi:succinoglycan biosynthesis protein ExoL
MRITYLANDLSEPAVIRRVEMLQLAGVIPKVIGFRRTAKSIDQVAGIPALDLGRTYDGRFNDRALKVMKTLFGVRRWSDVIKSSDIVLARNLDMAIIADCARVWSGSDARLVYECLDIHGLLLKSGLPSRALKAMERRLVRRSAALIVSSPAFLDNHFGKLGVALPTVIMAENKRLPDPAALDRPNTDCRHRAPPWRVGWFGNLRCTESFEALRDLAARYPDLLDVELRGRPTAEVQALIDARLPLPNMRFKGTYAQAELGALYQDRDLTWAIDKSQAGQNSDWLLPNRIYEGGFFNCPPIAMQKTETAKWLTTRRAGAVVQDLQVDLERFFTQLTPTQYRVLKQGVEAIPTSDLVYSVTECRAITALLRGGPQEVKEPARASA